MDRQTLTRPSRNTASEKAQNESLGLDSYLCGNRTRKFARSIQTGITIVCPNCALVAVNMSANDKRQH